VLTGVSADQLGDATPCVSWDVAALINHIVGGQRFFLAALNSKPSDAPSDGRRRANRPYPGRSLIADVTVS
jgi:hypothetical protein